MLVVSFHECRDHNPQLFDVPVGAAVDDLLFESPVEPLCHPVGLWLRVDRLLILTLIGVWLDPPLNRISVSYKF